MLPLTTTPCSPVETIGLTSFLIIDVLHEISAVGTFVRCEAIGVINNLLFGAIIEDNQQDPHRNENYPDNEEYP